MRPFFIVGDASCEATGVADASREVPWVADASQVAPRAADACREESKKMGVGKFG